MAPSLNWSPAHCTNHSRPETVPEPLPLVGKNKPHCKTLQTQTWVGRVTEKLGPPHCSYIQHICWCVQCQAATQFCKLISLQQRKDMTAAARRPTSKQLLLTSDESVWRLPCGPTWTQKHTFHTQHHPISISPSWNPYVLMALLHNLFCGSLTDNVRNPSSAIIRLLPPLQPQQAQHQQ